MSTHNNDNIHILWRIGEQLYQNHHQIVLPNKSSGVLDTMYQVVKQTWFLDKY